MRRIRAIFPSQSEPDSGMTLIELVVAMMVFAVLATGIAYTMIATLSATRDVRSREVATNLAAQEIDLARSAGDVFSLVDANRTIRVGGLDYTIARSTMWVDSSGGSASCGAGGGALQYKRVNVGVTWPGNTDKPVWADTLVAPDSKINDPTKGTIIVWVRDENGIGVPGVPISASPAAVVDNTATALATSPLPTDSQGCSYILKAEPGSYDVTASKAGYISSDQQPTSTALVSVGAGLSGSANFEYNLAASVPLNLASNDTTGSAKVPTNLKVTFLNSYGEWATPVSVSRHSASVDRYPYRTGYEIVAGVYEPDEPSCLSADPSQWEPSSDGRVGTRQPIVNTPPGQTVNPAVDIPMGIVRVTNSNSQNYYVHAITTAAPAGSGDPGCTAGQDYSFGRVLPARGSVTLALPYGSWTIHTSTSAGGSRSTIAGSSVIVDPAEGIASGNVVTLDPRRLP